MAHFVQKNHWIIGTALCQNDAVGAGRQTAVPTNRIATYRYGLKQINIDDIGYVVSAELRFFTRIKAI